MRRRPVVRLSHVPRPRVGGVLDARVSLTSRARTPVDAIRVTLVGTERRLTTHDVYAPVMMVPVGTIMAHEFLRLTCDALRAPLLLKANRVFEVPVVFAIPPEALASLEGRLATVTYELEVHVDIPFWPDRKKSFRVVVAGDDSAATGSASVASGRSLRLTVTNPSVEAGEVVKGRIESVAAAASAVESAEVWVRNFDVQGEEKKMTSLYARLVQSIEQPRASNLPHAFTAAIPVNAELSFEGVLGSTRWCVEARAQRPGFADRVLRVPIEVRARQKNASASSSTLAGIAARLGLVFDTQTRELRGEAGSVLLMIKAGTVSFGWAPLGLAMMLGERSWRDAFAPAAIALGDEPFDRKFVLAGREPEQLASFFTLRLREFLRSFKNVRVDDYGAQMRWPQEPGEDADAGFFRDAQNAIALARVFDESIRSISVPRGLEAHRAVWEAAAKTWGGQWCAGSFSIRAVTHRGSQAELVVIDGVALARVICPIDAAALASAAAARVIRAVSAECALFRIAPDGVEASVNGLLEFPLKAEGLWRALTRVAVSLQPAPPQAPVLAR